MTDAPRHKAEGPEEEITSEGLDLLAEHAAGAPPLGHAVSRTEREDAPAVEAPEESDEAEEEESEPEAPPAPKLERLQKILAQAGIASRRHAEELITQGRVQVNGQVVATLGSKADPARDHIRVDGKLLHGSERHRYFVLNKPRGYVTTASDPEGRPTVVQFFGKMRERLYPVGRLDFQSEGLLLVTNDGDLANGLTRAASGVEKTYLVKVAGQPRQDFLNRLRDGVSIDRGKQGEGRVRTAPARIRQIRAGENPWFEVVLIEGRNRELRKIFEEIGHHVEKIRRVGYGPLILDVAPGEFRELKPDEIAQLRLAAEGKLKPRRMNTSMMLPPDAGKRMDRDQGRTGDRRAQRKPSGDRRTSPQPARDREIAGPARKRFFRPTGQREERLERGPQGRDRRGGYTRDPRGEGYGRRERPGPGPGKFEGRRAENPRRQGTRSQASKSRPFDKPRAGAGAPAKSPMRPDARPPAQRGGGRRQNSPQPGGRRSQRSAPRPKRK